MQNLKEVRRARGLRQEDAARAAGVHQTTISRWERGVLMTTPKRSQEILTAIDALPKRTESENTKRCPLSGLRAEAAAVRSLLAAIIAELRVDGDREALEHLAKLASSRQQRVLACLKVQGDSLLTGAQR